MTKMLNRLFWYWIIGLVLVGFASASVSRDCPSEPPMKSTEVIGWALAWPAAIAYAVGNGRAAVCRTGPAP